MNVSRWLAHRRMAALTKAVYDSALTDEDEPAEPSVARFLPGGATVAALILVVVLIAAVGVWRHAASRERAQAFAQSSSEGAESESAPVAAGPSPSAPTSAGDRADVVVYVSGAVASPGVLTLPATSRVIDALTAAGGATPEADLESINLARILVDGEQIRVGVVGESPPPASSAAGPTAGTGTCVRLATATETELQTLPGIGPALAQRIISYRSTHPRLTSVDELDDVPGIGPSLIEKIRPGVCA